MKAIHLEKSTCKHHQNLQQPWREPLPGKFGALIYPYVQAPRDGYCFLAVLYSPGYMSFLLRMYERYTDKRITIGVNWQCPTFYSFVLYYLFFPSSFQNYHHLYRFSSKVVKSMFLEVLNFKIDAI